jgi:hypothetical protein
MDRGGESLSKKAAWEEMRRAAAGLPVLLAMRLKTMESHFSRRNTLSPNTATPFFLSIPLDNRHYGELGSGLAASSVVCRFGPELPAESGQAEPWRPRCSG